MKPMRWTGDRAKDKAELLRRVARTKAKIEQYLRDVASYNANFLPAGEPPIEADPDGEVRRSMEFCNRALAGEMFAD